MSDLQGMSPARAGISLAEVMGCPTSRDSVVFGRHPRLRARPLTRVTLIPLSRPPALRSRCPVGCSPTFCHWLPGYVHRPRRHEGREQRWRRTRGGVCPDAAAPTISLLAIFLAERADWVEDRRKSPRHRGNVGLRQSAIPKGGYKDAKAFYALMDACLPWLLPSQCGARFSCNSRV